MSLPPFVPFPTSALRKQIDPQEWEAFLSAWSTLAQAYLSLPDQKFAQQVEREDARLAEFLVSFTREGSQEKENFLHSAAGKRLKNSCISLLGRLTKDSIIPRKCLQPSFIGDTCLLYAEFSGLSNLVEEVWMKGKLDISSEVVEDKTSLAKALESSPGTSNPTMELKLRRTVAWLKASESYSRLMMQGSDFIDALVIAWGKSTSDLKRKLIAILYYGLISLLQGKNNNISLFLDHLYSLKSDHEARKKDTQSSSLLTDLLINTSIFSKFQSEPTTNNGRGKSMLEYLQAIRNSAPSSRVPTRRKTRKVKGKEPTRSVATGDLHMHRLSLVTQVQDLFPDLAASRILTLLDIYADDTEKVIAYLLENPPSPNASQPQPEPQYTASSSANLQKDTTIQSLPIRRNIYDDDALSNLTLTTGSLHLGRRETTAPTLQAPNTSAKAAILSALASFDSDSDERDDTYDADDVGGTIDTTLSAEEASSTAANAGLTDATEGILFAAWESDNSVFARDSGTRKGKDRALLKEKTGLTDEVIEGWAAMLARDGRRQKRLKERFGIFRGEQKALQSTAWRADADSEGGDGDTEADHLEGQTGPGARHPQSYRGRGRGRGRGSGRGNSAGTTGDKSTQVDRRRKDANKSSRANHNRRNQRAKKVARAGFPG
jgi:activating signal cointegrator complex subunit 2